MVDKFIPETGLGQDYWEKEFHKIPLPGMVLMEVTFFRTMDAYFAEKHKKFIQLSTTFLLMLGEEKKEELEALNFSDEQIALIKRGRLPENYVVHMKYPFEYGGLVNFENMVLMPLYPYHYSIHSYMERQLITEKGPIKPQKLYVPTPEGKIYRPSSMDGGGGGGKAKITQKSNAFNLGGRGGMGM